MKNLHPTQIKILNIADNYNLQKMGFRKIGRLINEFHPQAVKYHIDQLKRKELLDENLSPVNIRKELFQHNESQKLFSVPIVGSANCGDAKLIAEENIEGFVKLSSKMIGDPRKVFILKAEGNSMNKANIGGKKIVEGDYVLVDGKNKNPQNGEYIVSIIDGAANIKRFFYDGKEKQVFLTSESTEDYPPICIHKDDLNDYFIAGIVRKIIKPPKFNDITYEPSNPYELYNSYEDIQE